MADPIIQPEGKTVWTDEFDPAGEYLPESVIRVRRARRAYKAAPVDPPLGLDLGAPADQPSTQQRLERPPGNPKLFATPEGFDTMALVQALRKPLV